MAMTFNEGMQIDTSTTSTSGGGRGPGRGIAIGGGVGGLLILVVALFLGVDPSTVIPQQQQIDTEGVDARASISASARPARTPTTSCSVGWSQRATRSTVSGSS